MEDCVETYEIRDIHDRGPDQARLVKYGVSVWALIGHLRLVNWSEEETAAAYGLPVGAVRAAIRYYEEYRPYIDAWLLLNAS